MTTQRKPILCWWSGGMASAVACHLALAKFGHAACEIVFEDTHNEHPDTYRFMRDCARWYGMEITTIASAEWKDPLAVWEHYGSLNTAHGAICSTLLKRKVREAYQATNAQREAWAAAGVEHHQVFGYDADEANRAEAFTSDNPELKPIYPLMAAALGKRECASFLASEGIPLPVPYLMGYRNNNCWQTGCVRGGIGYWQKLRRDDPPKFARMATLEHRYTMRRYEKNILAGMSSPDAAAISAATILKDRSGGVVRRLFLLPMYHHAFACFPFLAQKRTEKVVPLAECNGFCQIAEELPEQEADDAAQL